MRYLLKKMKKGVLAAMLVCVLGALLLPVGASAGEAPGREPAEKVAFSKSAAKLTGG